MKKIIITESQYKKIEDYINGGLSDGKTIMDISKKHKVPIETIKQELRVGIKIEMEHTKNKGIANEIALDHLYENPRYYTILRKVNL